MAESGSNWNFFSNYTHVLVCIAENPDVRMREVAERVGVTERTAMRLISQLDESGILIRVKEGRRNRYLIDTREHLRHPIESHCTVGELLATILSPADSDRLRRQLNAFLRKRRRKAE